MKNRTRSAAGLLALVALAFPAAAPAKKGESPAKGDRPGHERKSQDRSDRLQPWNVQGVVTAKDDAASTVTVKIRRSSHGTRALRDTEVTFDMSDARVLVRDTNADGERNLADVAVGDRAQIKARRPRKQALVEGQAVPAKLGVFKAPKPPAEEPEGEQPEVEAPESES